MYTVATMKCPTCASEVYPGPTCSACGASLPSTEAAFGEPVLATVPAGARLRYQLMGGNASPLARVELAAGQSLNAGPDALVARSEHVEEKPQKPRGAFAALRRAVARGPSVSTYTALGGAGELLLAPAVPGELAAVEMEGRPLLVHSSAWLACEPTVALDEEFSGFGGLLSAGGLSFIRLSGSGVALLSFCGALVRRPLPALGRYLVDIDYLAAFDARLPFEVLSRRDGATIRSRVWGEAHMVALRGPGEVWLQTRGLKSLGEALLPQKNRGAGWSQVPRE